MLSPNPLRTPAGGRRPARRWLTAALVGAAAVTATAGMAPAASAAPRPAAIDGDPHSPRVAQLATAALGAQETVQRHPSAAAEQAYDRALAELADATAQEMGLSEVELEAAWQRADGPHQTAFLTALTQLGAPYRSHSSDPEAGFDCSGLTSFAWREAGVELSRQSGSQISEAESRTVETAIAGDLAQYPGHVMLYLGVPGAIVHASNPEHDVELWQLGDRSVRFGDPSGLPAYVDPESAAEPDVAAEPDPGAAAEPDPGAAARPTVVPLAVGSAPV